MILKDLLFRFFFWYNDIWEEIEMSNELVVINLNQIVGFEEIDETEKSNIRKAQELLEVGFPDHSLIELWNASSHNLKRRIENYSVEMFTSLMSNNNGRSKYDANGENLVDRWSGVDDYNLIQGAVQLGLIDRKTGKTLEMVNWMRNHSSAAHESECTVSKEDVLGLVQLLASNLFQNPMPDPIHSPNTLIQPIKNDILDESQIQMYKEQISNYNRSSINMLNGFAISQIILGDQPAYDNLSELYPIIWNKLTQDEKSKIGYRYYELTFSPKKDNSTDNGGASRIYEQLVLVDGVRYIPDSCRASIYRGLAKRLANAKDTTYGWSSENAESRALKQVGVYVPDGAFEEVYQEILSVWCGNYWGRSQAFSILHDFVFKLSHKHKMKLVKLFEKNDRVKEELFSARPKKHAIELLNDILDTLNIESQKNEVLKVIKIVKEI